MFGALAALALLAAPGHAQTSYPEQPIRFVVGFPPGGGMDTLARLVGQKASEHLGQEIVVENRPGAGGTIAAAYVANAAPDGYTLYVGETAYLVGPIIHENVGYDPLESFVPVAHLSIAPFALVANPSLPADTLEEFIQLVSENPGEYFYASSGVGTVHHLSAEILQREANLDMVHVPFQGGAPSVAAIVSGEVPLGIVSLNAAVSQAEAGNLKILGVTTEERVPAFPDIPTIGEVVPGFSGSPSQFIMAPAGTPDEIVETLESALEETMKDQALRDSLTAQGLIPSFMDAEALAAELPEIAARWTEPAKALDEAAN